MVVLASDLNGDLSLVKKFAATEGASLTKRDCFILLGDTGVCKDNIEELRSLAGQVPFNLMLIDGNHEDYSFIEKFDTSSLMGGTVRDLGGLYLLCRGEIFELPSKNGTVKVAVMGGGDSRDRQKRTQGVDWFMEERVSEGDLERLRKNAERYSGRVDLFLSHSTSSAVKLTLMSELSGIPGINSESLVPTESDYMIRDAVATVKAREYISGHEHIDRSLTLSQTDIDGTVNEKRYRIIYSDVVMLDL